MSLTITRQSERLKTTREGRKTSVSDASVSANVYPKQKRASFDARKVLILKVGAIGFEPTTSRSRTERSTRLSHAPLTAFEVLSLPAKNEGA
jgi:hypothetical protein